MAESEFDESGTYSVSEPPITPSMVTIRDLISDDLSVFPPVNHEGLHISSHSQSTTHHKSTDSSPDSSSSSSPCHSSSSSSSFTSPNSISVDSDGFGDALLLLPPDASKDCHLASLVDKHCGNRIPELRARTPLHSFGWLRFGLEIMRRRIWNFTPSVYGFGHLSAAFRSFPLMMTVAGVYVASLVLDWVRLRRSREFTFEMLVGKIREQDEKIVKLMDQIAILNEAFLSHQRSH